MSESLPKYAWGAKAFYSSKFTNVSTEWCVYCVHTPTLPPSPRLGVGTFKSPSGHSHVQQTLRTTGQGEWKSK